MVEAYQSPPPLATPACPPVKTGDQLRHQGSGTILDALILANAIDFPILQLFEAGYELRLPDQGINLFFVGKQNADTFSDIDFLYFDIRS